MEQKDCYGIISVSRISRGVGGGGLLDVEWERSNSFLLPLPEVKVKATHPGYAFIGVSGIRKCP